MGVVFMCLQNLDHARIYFVPTYNSLSVPLVRRVIFYLFFRSMVFHFVLCRHMLGEVDVVAQ